MPETIKVFAVALGVLVMLVLPPAALLVAGIVYFAEVHRKDLVWGLYLGCVVVLAVACVIAGQATSRALDASLEMRLLIAVLAVAVLFLPVPLIMDVVGQPQVRMRYRAMVALAVVLLLTLLTSPLLIVGAGCRLAGACL